MALLPATFVVEGRVGALFAGNCWNNCLHHGFAGPRAHAASGGVQISSEQSFGCTCVRS